MRNRILLLAATLTLAACSDRSDLILTLDDVRGSISGIAFVDQNGDGLLSPGENTVAGVLAAVVVEGSVDTVARATTGANGVFLMPDVPVGLYRLLVSRGPGIGDTLDILPLDSARVVLTVGDTAVRSVRLAFQTLPVSQLPQITAGRRIALEGIALNAWSTFGDSTVHLTDASGSVRALRVAPGSFAAGDSVRVVGSVGVDQGRAALVDASVRVLAPGRGMPAPQTTTTAAARAGAGKLPYAQVSIAQASITDTARVGTDRRITINDGSGPLDVLLDASVPFTLGDFLPGATLQVTGVLVPVVGGTGWQLKPRLATETTVTFPTVSIAQARGLPAGRNIIIEGIALNATSTFGDSTVHVMDRTGSIRAVRVPNPIAGGDSVRVLGALAVRNGQPVLSVTAATVRRAGVGVPEPDSISTVRASHADNGARDAGLVRAAGTIQGTQMLPNGDQLLSIDDGSGLVEVIFDASVVVPAGSFVPGAVLNVRGVLVPTGSGSWRIHPRLAADINASFATVTVAELKRLPAGKRVYVRGLALNSLSTFGDASVHIADGTGAVRITGVPSSPIFAGDSLRVLGTVALSAGIITLQTPAVEVLRAGVGLPVPDSISTQEAATAATGVRDAARVRVAGRVTSVQTETTGDVHLALNDGSGSVVLRLDRDAGFATGSYQIGDRVSIAGLLFPEGFPGFWLLRSGQLSDVLHVPGGAPIGNSFRTTWREYLPGELPSGWSTRWDRSTVYNIALEPTAREGKVLQWGSAAQPRDRWALGFDGFGDIGDQDAYAEFRVRSLSGSPPEHLVGVLAVRISGTAANEAGYALFLRQKADGTRELLLATFNAGVLVELATTPFAWIEDAWYAFRLEAIGTSIRARAWDRGAPEPTDWSVSKSDATTATGRPGVVNQDSGIMQWQVWEGRRR